MDGRGWATALLSFALSALLFGLAGLDASVPNWVFSAAIIIAPLAAGVGVLVAAVKVWRYLKRQNIGLALRWMVVGILIGAALVVGWMLYQTIDFSRPTEPQRALIQVNDIQYEIEDGHRVIRFSIENVGEVDAIVGEPETAYGFIADHPRADEIETLWRQQIRTDHAPPSMRDTRMPVFAVFSGRIPLTDERLDQELAAGSYLIAMISVRYRDADREGENLRITNYCAYFRPNEGQVHLCRRNNDVRDVIGAAGQH